MPPTVKSLEERIDEMAEDLSAVKEDVAAVKTDVAVLKTDGAVLKSDVAGLRTDIKGLTREFDGFRGRVETAISLIRWLGVFSAGVAVTVLFMVMSAVREAGRLEATIEEQSRLLRDLTKNVSEL